MQIRVGNLAQDLSVLYFVGLALHFAIVNSDKSHLEVMDVFLIKNLSSIKGKSKTLFSFSATDVGSLSVLSCISIK